MEREQKEHRIQTVQDMVDVVTRDNLDCLLTDLRSHLVLAMTARETQAYMMTRPGVMQWIDDGRCDVQLSGPPPPSGCTEAVQEFHASYNDAVQRLVTASLVTSGNTASTVHVTPHRPHDDAPSHSAPNENATRVRCATREAWVESDEEAT